MYSGSAPKRHSGPAPTASGGPAHAWSAHRGLPGQDSHSSCGFWCISPSPGDGKLVTARQVSPFPLLSPPGASRVLGTRSHKCLFPCLPCHQGKSHFLPVHTLGTTPVRSLKQKAGVMIPFSVLQVTSLKTLGASSQDSFPFNLI